MAVQNADLDRFAELFASLGVISWRKMFGGAGLYCDGLIFALVDDGHVFVKADRVNEAWYAERGSEPFVYPSEKGPMTMSYWRVPNSATQSPELAEPWGQQGIEASRRATQKKTRKG